MDGKGKKLKDMDRDTVLWTVSGEELGVTVEIIRKKEKNTA